MSTKLQALQNNIGKLQGLLAGKYKIDQPTLEVCCDGGRLFVVDRLKQKFSPFMMDSSISLHTLKFVMYELTFSYRSDFLSCH